MPPENPADAPDLHATTPAEERGTRSLDNPDDSARWLALADTALRQGARDEDVSETEALARKEQAAIKRRIRRTAEKVKRQSKSKQ
jgi:hypothetical protein